MRVLGKSILPWSMVITLAFNSLSAPAQTFNAANPAGRTGPGMDLEAYEIFYQMLDQTIDLEAREIYPGIEKTPVTFGAEKEGSSSKILRIMSPANESLTEVVSRYPDKAIPLLRELLSGRMFSREPVIDKEGKTFVINQEALQELRAIDWSRFENQPKDQYEQIADENLRAELKAAAAKIPTAFPKPFFAFLKKKDRKAIWETPHFNAGYAKDGTKMFRNYDSWLPLPGEPELYIYKGHEELNKGWEVIFKPQRTYADFEKQMMWFREKMGTGTQLFEAPGHNRVVMPRIPLAPDQQDAFKGRAAELNRMLLSYIVLRGLKGNTGLFGGKHKAIPSEGDLANLVTGRGPIRLELNRFYENSIGVEFRAGMKDDLVRRFSQAVYTSRLASNQMSDLAQLKDYNLIPMDIYPADHEKAWQPVEWKAEDYGVDKELFDKAMANFKKIRTRHNREVARTWLVPLWQWWNAPFLAGKAPELKRLSQQFIQQLAALENPTYSKVSKMMSDWASGSNLLADVEHYLTPKKSLNRVSSALLVPIAEGKLDVNKIDLGNEFTARLPLHLKAQYDDQGKWLSTIYDMTPEEREAKIKSFAVNLQKAFGVEGGQVTRLGSGSHGHSLSIAYELKDQHARTWRVEWDGVIRNYDADGNILPETARGGHIEIVSPKYNPTMTEIEAVYSTMKNEGMIPDYKMGGSHINIDFAAFEGNPRALARFLHIFHQNRDVISFMFQHINRLRSAEPVEVSSRLSEQLRDFNGTEAELAKLLYNEGYFNGRQNRKTRYTQIDMSNYMGQVIPPEFIKPDFDVVKAKATGGEGWSRQFRVTKYKKLEFRLFDAAKDPVEAALQIKIVRAMLNKALNETGPLSAEITRVDHEAFARNPEAAYKALQRTLTDLKLDYLDYSPFVTNKLVITKAYIGGKFYRNWFTEARSKFPQAGEWGRATEARTGDNKIFSDNNPLLKRSTRPVVQCMKVHRL